MPVLDLARDLIDRYGDDAVMLQYFQNEIFSESLDDMVQIGLFLLLDRTFSARAGEIAEYFKEHQNKTGGYRIKQDEILMVIRKCADCDEPAGRADRDSRNEGRSPRGSARLKTGKGEGPGRGAFTPPPVGGTTSRIFNEPE